MSELKLDWKREMVWLTVVYRMLECNERIPVVTAGTQFAFAEPDLTDMHAHGLLSMSGDGFYEVTDKGRELRSKLLAIYDQVTKFEIFGSVSVALELPEDITDDEGNIMDHCYDPRFDPEASAGREEELGTEDMRIAMMAFLSEKFVKSGDLQQVIDPHRVVFVQFLAKGKLRHEKIWFDLKLGTFFNEVENIVESQYKWTDTGNDVEESTQLMDKIYELGRLEERKREGFECSACGIPLALFEAHAKADEEELTHCPNPECEADLREQTHGEEEYECPNCGGTVYQGMRCCGHCGVTLDFTMPPGTIVEETETIVEEEVVEDDYGPIWGGYYDYSPYGYYDPWDPYVDLVAFGVVVAVLW